MIVLELKIKDNGRTENNECDLKVQIAQYLKDETKDETKDEVHLSNRVIVFLERIGVGGGMFVKEKEEGEEK